jgi:hypothetical protein
MEPEHAPAQSSIFKVGLPLQLVIGSGQDTVNCGSTLLGWRERAWLICEWPFHFGQAVPCETGTRCLVRSMVAGHFPFCTSHFPGGPRRSISVSTPVSPATNRCS